VLELLIVGFLIVLNAFFALSEMSLMTSRKLRLKQMAIESRGARVALSLAEHPDNLLSTVQIGINLIGILGGVFGGDAIGAIIAGLLTGWFPGIEPYAGKIGVAVAVTLITIGYVIFGELIPKRLALTNPERSPRWSPVRSTGCCARRARSCSCSVPSTARCCACWGSRMTRAMR